MCYNTSMKNQITKYALLHSLGATAYIALVALTMRNIERFIGPDEGDGGTLSMIAFLLLFVISAAVMGLLVFTRPIMWYLNGSKKEALSLAISTVGFLVGIAVLIFLTLFLGWYN